METQDNLENMFNEQVTALIHNLLQQLILEDSEDIRQDLLHILTFILLIDNDFVLHHDNEEDSENMNLTSHLLNLCRTRTKVLEAHFYLKGFKNPKLKVMMSQVGEIVVINFIVPELDFDTYSLCLPISKYIVPKEKITKLDVPNFFKNLKTLTLLFKNNISCPLKSKILKYYGYVSASLTGLPNEVVRKILLKLNIYSIVQLTKICLQLKHIIDDNTLWHNLFIRDFHIQHKKMGNSLNNIASWKEEYKKEYLQLKNNKRNIAYIDLFMTLALLNK